MAKINVVRCELKVDKGTYKVYSITDSDGKVYDCYSELSPGETDVEIIKNPNPVFPDKIQVSQKKNFFSPKNPKLESKKAALVVAAQLCKDPKEALSVAKAFYEWLSE